MGAMGVMSTLVFCFRYLLSLIFLFIFRELLLKLGTVKPGRTLHIESSRRA